MAQKLQVLLTCDLDEDDIEAVGTVTFGYEGVNYAFELCAEHLKEFGDVMEGFTSVARRADGARRPRSVAAGGRSGAGAEDPAAIRGWAREAGYEVSARGRIPAEIRVAYEAANRGARK